MPLCLFSSSGSCLSDCSLTDGVGGTLGCPMDWLCWAEDRGALCWLSGASIFPKTERPLVVETPLKHQKIELEQPGAVGQQSELMQTAWCNNLLLVIQACGCPERLSGLLSLHW